MRRQMLPAILLAGCAAGAAGSHELHRYTDHFEAALEVKDVDFPKRARTLGDIRLIGRVLDAAMACVPGRGPAYSVAWLQANRGAHVHTSIGDKTIGELAQTCSTMLDSLEARTVEACGARYVQVERALDAGDRWAAPQIAHTTNGWYMTPCDRHPSQGLLAELRPLELPLRNACEDPKASLYVVGAWSDVRGEARGRQTVTVACMSPAKQRYNWLPGNPALGLK